MDSIPIPICHPKRAKINKGFTGLAAWGKSSMGWFFGFKLHLIIKGFTSLAAWGKSSMGWFFGFKLHCTCARFNPEYLGLSGDQGYIKKELWSEVWNKNIKLITPLKKNMNNKLMLSWKQIMLRKRSLIETVNDQLKNISQSDASRH
ncbi:transposase [Moorena sp. SIO4A5]|uniref:transposase n=1 Tax=Moorena sp. SIO4A5 TaxID=2607838 RepID=UPI0025D81077|nr:transposase [Moorena sp. SIO4A5]